jgi:hypothetical protein
MLSQPTYDWSFRDRTGRVHRRVTRGPLSIDEMIVAARRLMREQTLQAIDQGGGDPGLELLDVTPGAPTDALFGQPLRAGARPVELDEFAGRDGVSPNLRTSRTTSSPCTRGED